MAILDRIWVIHTTANNGDADTDDGFTLHLPATGKAADSFGFFVDFPDLPHDERERGRTDEYEFDVRRFAIDAGEARGKIRLVAKGGDAWLPRSLWVIGRSTDGGFHLLANRPRWPKDEWFSTDSSEGKKSHTL